ncbi:MAG: MBL fold metallo-hydrolase [Clostridia bacterium]|nr:MBL fold metallo-hydrolase [Clostridia bacterium]
MAKRRSKKKRGKLFTAVIIVIVIIIIALAVLYFVKPEVYDKFFDLTHNELSEGGTSGGEVVYGDKDGIVSAELSIHFLELGNQYTGDCTLIKCGDTEVLIDAGSRQSSAETLCEYINEYCTDGKLEYVIATHSDRDHISGFYGNSSGSTRTGILYQYEIGTLIMYDKSNSTSGIADNFESAVESLAENGTTVYTASQCYDQTDGAQRQYYLDSQSTISINILYNYYYYNKASDNNDYSVVMLLTQQTDSGKINYLFTGDLEEDGESRMVDYYADIPEAYKTDYNVLPEVKLFKGGHHGSYSSTTDKLLAVIKPENIAICCCVGTTEYNPSVGHEFPAQEVITRISKYTDNVYCTSFWDTESESGYSSMNGNIVFYYSKDEGENEGSVKLWCSNNTTILKDTEWFKANRTWG